MSYPEKGATYRNKPAWMDRAIAGEKRAEGGAIDMPKVDARAKTVPMPMVDKPDTGDRMEGTRVDGKGSVGQLIKDTQQKMGRGIGQSIGFKRGGSAGC